MKKISIVFAIFVMVLLYMAAMPENMFFGVLQNFEDQTGEKCSSELDGFKLCTASGKLFADVGKEITFTVLVKNTGDKDVKISNPIPIEIRAFNENGESIPTISQNKAEENKVKSKTDPDGLIYKSFRSHRDAIEIKSQQSWERIVRVSKEYDLNEKGKYFIEVKIKLPTKQQNDFVEFTLDKIEIVVK